MFSLETGRLDSKTLRFLSCVSHVPSATSFIEWLLRIPRTKAEQACPTARTHQAIDPASVHQIKQPQSQKRGGSAKIAERLQKSDDLESACRNTVATAMRELGIKSRVSKSFMPTTTMADPSKLPAENKLDRDFTAEAPNRKWVTGITYLPTANGWVYLAVVLDLFGRKVVGWSIGHYVDNWALATELVSEALRKAIEKRRPDGSKLSYLLSA